MNDNNIGIDSAQWIKITKDTTRVIRGQLGNLYDENEYFDHCFGRQYT